MGDVMDVIRRCIAPGKEMPGMPGHDMYSYADRWGEAS